MKKNRFIAVFLAQVPGLGHAYLGLFSRGVKAFLLVSLVLIIQLFFIDPITFSFIEKIGWSSRASGLLSILFDSPLLVAWGWNIVDVFFLADKVNRKGF